MSRVLVVDDDLDLLETTSLCLKQAGYEVVTARNKTEGFEQVNATQPDLVVLDVMMEEPDDGIALAQQLRRNAFDKPILMMSCIEKVTGMQYGRDDEMVPVDEFLPKPANPTELVQVVKRLLAAKEV
jgi:DNA-binding response OmpR family regulator